ncbi:MAG: phosphatidate cytidylyltransferase [bacterium]|nr:phosphatidate cytidylyltransferase [bacterium]
MLTRIVTAVVGGVALLWLLLYSPFTSIATVALLHAMAVYEYARLEPRMSRYVVVLYVFLGTAVITLSSLALMKVLAAEIVPALAVALAIIVASSDLFLYDRTGDAGRYGMLSRGVLLITLPFCFVAPISHWLDGFPYLLLLIGASFGCDVGGIMVGRFSGRRKLATRLSPKKTWEGLIGGMLAAAACWMVTVSLWTPNANIGGVQFADLSSGMQLTLAALGGMVTALFGIAGDLTFSLLKRQHGIKDYGTLLPGHGGILDRFDALLFCAPLVYLVCLL